MSISLVFDFKNCSVGAGFKTQVEVKGNKDGRDEAELENAPSSSSPGI